MTQKHLSVALEPHLTTQTTHHQPHSHAAEQECCAHTAHTLTQPQAQSQLRVQAGQQLSVWYIQQMDCPTEERLLRSKLAHNPAVIELQFNLIQRVLQVVHTDGAQQQIMADIASLGMQAQPMDSDIPPVDTESAGNKWRQSLQIGTAVALALVAEVGHWLAMPSTLVVVVALAALALTGGAVYKKGLIALKNRNLNINALMSIAVTGAVLLGNWPEAAMVMSLFALAELIEARSLARVRTAVDGLLALTPEWVEVLDTQGQWHKQLAQHIPVGSLVKALPGARIGLDGRIEQGQSVLNQAPITGESQPVEKSVGDTVYAGSVNGFGELQYRTTEAYDHSVLARIAHSVQNAQQNQAPVQRFVDRFANIYTPIVTLMALAIALIGPWLWGGGWYEWVYKALVLLVIACPCALVISTPVAVVSALTKAAKLGLLVKGGAHLEQARHIDYLAVDKTGTISKGQPTLSASYVPANIDQGFVLALSKALAQRSDHPASLAVAQGVASEAVVATEITDFVAVAGAGVQAHYQQQQWRLGKLKWVLADVPAQNDAAFNQWLNTYQDQGAGFVFLANQQKLVAAFAIVDQIKAHSHQAISELQTLGVTVEMLSGDTRAAVQHMAQAAGIAQYQAELLPDEKLRVLEERAQQYQWPAMVGDGINDAPALAKAKVGFAMGALGSDMAIETADIAIMNDDVRSISVCMRLSQKLHKILVQNISVALGIKAVFLLWAIGGSATMWMAVFADVGASLLVILNSLRLLKFRLSA